VFCVITDETLGRVERVLRIRLYQWQRDFLLGLEPDMTLVPTRRAGHTLAFMLSVALDEGPMYVMPDRGPGYPEHRRCRDDIELPVDYPSYKPVLMAGYRQWYVQQYMALCRKLQAAGLRPRWIKGFYNSNF
jgi:hypothetical protein